MTGRVFVDSNILIYAHEAEAGSRQKQASALIRKLWLERRGCLSTQVLQEFYVNVTRKAARPLPSALAREVLRSYAEWVQDPISPGTILRATEIAEANRLSFWDSLILAAAEQQGAAVVASEDLNHGQRIAGMRVVNPFLEELL